MFGRDPAKDLEAQGTTRVYQSAIGWNEESARSARCEQ
jgi:hypothetical protein